MIFIGLVYIFLIFNKQDTQKNQYIELGDDIKKLIVIFTNDFANKV
jgi:hypothetical protein